MWTPWSAGSGIWSDWSNATNLTAEQRAALESVPVEPVETSAKDTVSETVDRLVADVLAFLEDVGSSDHRSARVPPDAPGMLCTRARAHAHAHAHALALA